MANNSSVVPPNHCVQWTSAGVANTSGDSAPLAFFAFGVVPQNPALATNANR